MINTVFENGRGLFGKIDISAEIIVPYADFSLAAFRDRLSRLIQDQDLKSARIFAHRGYFVRLIDIEPCQLESNLAAGIPVVDPRLFHIDPGG